MNNQESITKAKQERIKRAPERYNEDGTYNSRPKDPEYFNNYYKNHLESTMCACCKHSHTCLAGLNKHIVRSAKCKKFREFVGEFNPYYGNESQTKASQDLWVF